MHTRSSKNGWNFWSNFGAVCTKEKLLVTKVLKGNGFPASFIWCSAPPLSPTPTQEAEGTDAEQIKKQTTVTLPYIQGLSEPIKRILEQLKVTVRFIPDTALQKLQSFRTLIELQSEGASKRSSKWRHQCVGFGWACIEGGTQHWLAECRSARSEPAMLKAKVLVGVMAHQ